MNRFYIPAHRSTESRILGITYELSQAITGAIAKGVELHNIQGISRFVTVFSEIFFFALGGKNEMQYIFRDYCGVRTPNHEKYHKFFEKLIREIANFKKY